MQVVPALGWGGAQVFCIQLCNELVQREGYEVTLVSMYHHKPEKHLPLSLLDKRVTFISLGKKPALDPTMFFKLWKTMKQLKPDVVHTHLHAGYYCFLGYKRIKRAFRKIHTFHNLVKQDSPWMGRQAFKYFFGKRIIVPVSISEEVFKGAIEEYGAPIEALIPNGSDPVKPSPKFEETKTNIDDLKKDDNTKVLVNVARISAQKNQQLLLRCMNLLQKEGENVIALVVGDYVADDKKIYDGLIAMKPSNVHFTGKVNNVADYLLHADAFVLSSTFEGLPIALLEALSAGATPVCTAVGGLKDVVMPEIGYLSDTVSEDSYLSALQTFLSASDEELADKRKAGKELFEKNYSMKTCASRYDALYFGDT